ncbi:MAG: helix-turn-helix domain-containing protein [Saprospiraceae bacterium]|nr:helix-turn-helix domain-containing protein [Saprospiraceae bacterium]
MQIRRLLEKAESARLSELDRLKTRLYTNITHEFRTPLTLILGPVRKLLSKTDDVSSEELVSKLNVVKENGERLLTLVNQILDVQKLEAHHIQINYESGDVMALLRYIVNLFESIGDAKNIKLIFECNPPTFHMDYDKDKLLKIVTNLIANALKFTPAESGGQVKISASEKDNLLIIAVSDTGIGIPKDKVSTIFNLFYQVDKTPSAIGSGTGIGLTLVKELVEVLQGKITVESPDPSTSTGTLFLVQLPIIKVDKTQSGSKVLAIDLPKIAPDNKLPVSATVHSNDVNDDLPVVLIVEDNADVANFISECLSTSYRIEFATNGKSGMKRALELVPDLVISDVMMPEADGFEVCQFLKNDLRTSHIPVILLTALAGIKNRLDGLRRGADAYLSKPFYEEELLVTVEKLLLLRQSLLKRYEGLKFDDGKTSLTKIQFESSELQTNFDLHLEDAFIKKASDIIRLHLNDANFSVEYLCREMSMSNTQLFRKMKALTDQSAGELIQDIRLQKAKDLLLETNLTISEIAYETGFNDPAYFSRLFMKVEGMNPSTYRKGKSE